MSNKKLGVFLGGYLNYPNAQNFNCFALAKHLDKTRFNITALSLSSRPIIPLKEVTIHRCRWPYSLTICWAYFWNIMKADVVYLPKGELLGYNTFLCRLFKKKCFTTIEGILDETNFKKARQKSGSNFLAYYNRLTKRYSISNYIKQFNEDRHGLLTEPNLLELGTDPSLFTLTTGPSSSLQNVVMIAANFENKGIDDYLYLAASFPLLKFHLIGKKTDVLNQKIKQKKLENVVQHGYLDRDSYKGILSQMQLHILTSRSEGFPKVILETACSGLPSLVYGDYGANDWISNGKNGFVVDNRDQMKATLNDLIKDPNPLIKISEAAIQLGHSYDWNIKIKAWEEAILAICDV